MNYPKLVESQHYHIWTDALHARSLAKQANNRWDRGTYIRWTLITSWIVLEIACQDALRESEISYSFKRNLNKAIKEKGFNRLKWGSGIWQRVQELQDKRKGYVHRFISENDYFPDTSVADESIEIVRKAVVDIYQHVNRPVPAWIQDDYDRGWDSGKKFDANLTLIHAGADKSDPNVIKIYYVYQGNEKLSDVLPSGTKYMPYVNDLINSLRVPASEIKVYEGDNLVYKKELNMRGA